MHARGSTIVITGASDGIGRALALALAGEGANLVLAARTAPALVATAIHERRLGAGGVLRAEAPHVDQRMMAVDVCARQIVRAIARRDRELVMTATGKLALWLKLAAPGLLDRFIADAVRRFDGDDRAPTRARAEVRS